MHDLPFGWVRMTNGDIWDSDGPRARPVAYRVGEHWMVVGVRIPEELVAIAEIVTGRNKDADEIERLHKRIEELENSYDALWYDMKDRS